MQLEFKIMQLSKCFDSTAHNALCYPRECHNFTIGADPTQSNEIKNVSPKHQKKI